MLDRRRSEWAAIMLTCIIHTAAVAAPAGVRLSGGNIQYRDPNGNVRQLTQGGNFRDAVLSSDGHTIAFIHLDGQPTEEGEAGFTSL
jgi:hypothetical protein